MMTLSASLCRDRASEVTHVGLTQHFFVVIHNMEITYSYHTEAVYVYLCTIINDTLPSTIRVLYPIQVWV